MKQTPHVAMLSSPGMGHIIPMLEFAKRLIQKHDLSVTLIIPDSGLNPNEQNSFVESLPKGIDFILLPRPNLDDLQADKILLIFHTISRSLSSLRDVIRSLVAGTNLVALVVDFLSTAAFDVSREFDVSPQLFVPANAMTLSLLLHLPELDASVSGPYKHLRTPIQLPGCIPLRGQDLLKSFENRESFAYKWWVDQPRRYKMAEGIIVNTFHDMEGETIKALMQEHNCAQVFPIGPLVRQSDETWSCTDATKIWLDGQPQGSILFVCFGSMGLLSKVQIHELAFGLEWSGVRFLWVLGSSDSNPLALLPHGFAERTKGRGLLVSSWAPQAQILAHSSTGGFLTHCGWNSVLESVTNGVPMIAWPLYAEQKMNAALLTEGLEIAVRPRVNKEDGLVEREDIANSVKDLMEGEQGKKFRERTKGLKSAGEAALDADGQSTKSLLDFVHFLKPK